MKYKNRAGETAAEKVQNLYSIIYKNIDLQGLP
jgi:hypothetical protein